MTKAGTVAEILAVQQQLTSTREQIELIKGQMQYLSESARSGFIFRHSGTVQADCRVHRRAAEH